MKSIRPGDISEIHADILPYLTGQRNKQMKNSVKEYPVQSVARAVEILMCFQNQPEIGLTELARATGLHKSTTAGIVSTLQAKKFLDQNPKNNKYRLGLELFRLGVSLRKDFRDLCRPYLSELLETYGETVNLAVLDGFDIVYAEKMEGTRSMRICTQVGQHLPFHCTANGKCLVAFLPESAREDILASSPFARFTDNTITSISSMREELKTIRANGFARDNEELEAGLMCLAAPLIDSSGFAVASISLSGPAFRLNEEKQREIVSHLKAAAAKISRELPTVSDI